MVTRAHIIVQGHLPSRIHAPGFLSFAYGGNTASNVVIRCLACIMYVPFPFLSLGMLASTLAMPTLVPCSMSCHVKVMRVFRSAEGRGAKRVTPEYARMGSSERGKKKATFKRPPCFFFPLLFFSLSLPLRRQGSSLPQTWLARKMDRQAKQEERHRN